MDLTFDSYHVTDDRDHFIKKIFQKQVKKVTAKTAAKAGLNAEQTKAFQAKTNKMVTTGTFGKRLKAYDVAGKVVAGAAATALTAGLATGAIGLGGAGAAAAGAGKIGSLAGAGKIAAGVGAVGGGAKKSGLLDKIKDGISGNKGIGEIGKEVFSGTKAEQVANQIGDLLPTSVKENLKADAKQWMQSLKDRTSQELLPKTRPQKRLEEMTTPGNQVYASGSTLSLNNPAVIIAGVMLLIAVIAMIVKR
jgi:hypothetical protein